LVPLFLLTGGALRSSCPDAATAILTAAAALNADVPLGDDDVDASVAHALDAIDDALADGETV